VPKRWSDSVRGPYTCAIAAALVGEDFDRVVAGVGELEDDHGLGVRRAGVEFLLRLVPVQLGRAETGGGEQQS